MLDYNPLNDEELQKHIDQGLNVTIKPDCATVSIEDLYQYFLKRVKKDLRLSDIEFNGWAGGPG